MKPVFLLDPLPENLNLSTRLPLHLGEQLGGSSGCVCGCVPEAATSPDKKDLGLSVWSGIGLVPVHLSVHSLPPGHAGTRR